MTMNAVGDLFFQLIPKVLRYGSRVRCDNCNTAETSQWRKIKGRENEPEKFHCNACGLYYKLHGVSVIHFLGINANFYERLYF